MSARKQGPAIAGKYYFMLFKAGDDGEQGFGIVGKRFWNENHTFDDRLIGDEQFDSILPSGFNASEREWRYAGSREEGRKKLLDAGFEELENFFGW